MIVANEEIRKSIADAGLRHWQVAAEAGVDPSTLSVWLRLPMVGNRLARVKAAIAKLTKEAKRND